MQRHRLEYGRQHPPPHGNPTATANRSYDHRQRHKLGDPQIIAPWDWTRGLQHSRDDMNFTEQALSRISARTLIVYGDRDPLYPVEMAVEILLTGRLLTPFRRRTRFIRRPSILRRKKMSEKTIEIIFLVSVDMPAGLGKINTRLILPEEQAKHWLSTGKAAVWRPNFRPRS